MLLILKILLILGIAVQTFSCTTEIEPPPPLSNEITQNGISYGILSYQGQNYKTVKIGDQVWMAENLNYYADGSRCCGDNTGGDSQNRCGTYGRLYNWDAAMAVCPSGWHLPSDAEWTTLTNYVESQGGCSNCAGMRLKATSGWSSGNGSDDHGFSALPGGNGRSDGSFSNVGNYGSWWSANENNSNDAYSRIMYYNYESTYRYNYLKTNLFSVRCVQDE